MFFCKKWLSSGGRLEEPWLEANFNGNVPEYIRSNMNRSHLLQVCDDLLEVAKSTSKNPKHRISLQLSATLTRGVCEMYKKKAEQCLNDSTTFMYNPRSLKQIEHYYPDFASEETDSTADIEVREEQSSNSIYETDQHITQWESLSTEYFQVTEGSTHESEMEIPAIDGNLFNIAAPSHLEVIQEESQLTDDVENIDERLENVPNTVVRIQTPTMSDNFINRQEFEMCIDTINEENGSDGIVPCGSELNSPGIVDEKMEHSNKSSVERNNSKSELCKGNSVSSETISKCLKINEKYENFIDFINNLSPVDCADRNNFRKKKYFRMEDTKLKLSIKDIRKNISNMKCHTNSKDNASPEDVCRLELRNENRDREMDIEDEMQNITLRKQNVNSTSRSIVILDASPKDAVEMQGVDSCSRLSFNFKNISDVEGNSDKSVLSIDLSPLPFANTTNSDDSNKQKHSYNNENNQIMGNNSGREVLPHSTNSFNNATLAHKNVVNILLPMHLKDKIDPRQLKIIMGPIKNCDGIIVQGNSDIENETSSSDLNIFNQRKLRDKTKMNKEWDEDGVFRKLSTLWCQMRNVTPNKLLQQGSQCGDPRIARSKMFCSLLGLRSKRLIKCIKDNTGRIKYITKGSTVEKLCGELTE